MSSIYIQVAGAAARGPGWFFVETAGGIHSPGPTGTSQADLYRALRTPVVLAGDARLGGISATVAALESLRLRGYDVEAVLLFDDPRHRNHEYLARRLGDDHGVPVVALPPPPPRAVAAPEVEAANMARFYADAACDDRVRDVLAHLATQHDRRIQALEVLPAQSLDKIWYPFTQHKLLSPRSITAIDSAYGDHFTTLRPEARPPSLKTPTPSSLSSLSSSSPSASDPDAPLLQASFDGSASWWTQGLGHGDAGLTLAAAYAAGRYGHVMFAEAAHAPALALAEALLTGLGNPRLARVFYSDDGSTGVEVAVKMALRAARARYDGDGEGSGAAARPLDIVGLRGAYHGDTIGAMDCAEPSAFNRKVDWYQGKGLWFDPPAVLYRDGDDARGWEVAVPASWDDDVETTTSTTTTTPRRREFTSLATVFDLDAREARGEHRAYERYIEAVLRAHVGAGRRFGALVMEPVVLGAGGMVLVDPLFQRALVATVRRLGNLFGGGGGGGGAGPGDEGNPRDWAGLPVVFDEVFTGLYRLGRFSAASFLGVDPDISVHAKLLTGGLVPLCATLASDAVFGAFASDDKADALLHGHSYTAHAVGCEVAGAALRRLRALEARGAWDWAKHGGCWVDAPAPTDGHATTTTPDGPWSIWPRDLVHDLARRPTVDGVWALGSILAVHLRAPSGAGYTSTAAVALRDALRATSQDPGATAPWNVHSRVLGNVLYVMGSQRTGPEEVREIDTLLRRAMDVLRDS